MLAECDRVPVDAIEDTVRKDDVIASHLRKPVERDDRLWPEAELHRLERHDLAAIDVPLAHERRDVLEKCLRDRLLRRHHLDARASAAGPHVVVGTADECDERRPVHRQQVQAELNHGQDAVAVEVEVHPVDRTLREAEAVWRSSAAYEVGKTETPVALVLGRQPDELRTVTGLLEVGVHRDLQVRLLETLDFLGDHWHARRFATKVLAETLQERSLRDLRAVDDVIEETLEKQAELFRRCSLIHAARLVPVVRASLAALRRPLRASAGPPSRG